MSGIVPSISERSLATPFPDPEALAAVGPGGGPEEPRMTDLLAAVERLETVVRGGFARIEEALARDGAPERVPRLRASR